MTDRNYPPYSKNFYEEIDKEMSNLKKENPKKYNVEIELIHTHLQNMDNAFKLYKKQIELVLERIITKEELE